MIGSTLLHIVFFFLVIKVYPTAPVALCVVDAFIVASSVARLPEPTRSIPPKTGPDIYAGGHGTAPHQPNRLVERPASPRVVQAADTEAFPANDAPGLRVPQSAEQMASATALLAAAPISPLSVRPQKESSGGTSSTPSRQNFGTGQPMEWGSSGSPRFIHSEPPIYPFIARKLGKEGNVILRLSLGAQGQLQGVDIVESNGFGFAEAASAAIRKSTFAPAVRNGRAISSQVLVLIRFVMHEA